MDNNQANETNEQVQIIKNLLNGALQGTKAELNDKHKKKHINILNNGF